MNRVYTLNCFDWTRVKWLRPARTGNYQSTEWILPLLPLGAVSAYPLKMTTNNCPIKRSGPLAQITAQHILKRCTHGPVENVKIVLVTKQFICRSRVKKRHEFRQWERVPCINYFKVPTDVHVYIRGYILLCNKWCSCAANCERVVGHRSSRVNV